METVASSVFGTESFTTVAINRIAKRIRKAPRSDVISENYFSDVWSRSFFAGCGLFILGLIAVYLLEFSTAILALFLSFIVIGRIGLTKLRVRNGSFASNAQEAEEIISYLLTHHKQTGRPPGGQLSTTDLVHAAAGEFGAGDAVRGKI